MNIVKHLRYYWRLAVVLLCVTSAICTASVAYIYDAAGRMVAANYGAGNSASYAYDNAGNLLQSSQPMPGITVISLIGNQLTLSWPINPGGFVLQSASSLNPGAQWNNVGVSNAPSGNFNFVTLTVNATTFYRLKN